MDPDRALCTTVASHIERKVPMLVCVRDLRYYHDVCSVCNRRDDCWVWVGRWFRAKEGARLGLAQPLLARRQAYYQYTALHVHSARPFVATIFKLLCGCVDNSLWMLLLLLHALVVISSACTTAIQQTRQRPSRERLALRLGAGRHHDASPPPPRPAPDTQATRLQDRSKNGTLTRPF